MIGHPSRQELYFIGQFQNNVTNDIYQGICKTDYDFNVIQMSSVFHDPLNYHHSMDDDGNYLYTGIASENFLIEYFTSDLSISKYYEMTDVTFRNYAITKATGGYVFMHERITVGTIQTVCRWQRLATSIDCFHYSSTQILVFYPINTDTIFINIKQTGVEHLYFVTTQFSNSGTLNWEKYIPCTGTCDHGRGKAMLSDDSAYIYLLREYTDNVLFYVLDVSTGAPLGSGLIAAITASIIEDIHEIGGHILLLFRDNPSSQHVISYVDRATLAVTKELFSATYVGRSFESITYSGQELLVVAGTVTSIYTFLRSPVDMLERYSVFTERTSVFSNITATYLIVDTPAALPSLTQVSFAFTEQSPAAKVLANETVVTLLSGSIGFINTSDFRNSYPRDTLIQTDAGLGCSDSSDTTAITYSTEQLGSEAYPTWVSLDSSSQILTFDKTPHVNSSTSYQFRVKTTYGTEVYYKNFYITVEPCGVRN